jgi:hypothetical protein
MDAIDIGLGRVQRNFEPMQKQVEGWRGHQLTDGSAKNIIYDAFLNEYLSMPRHLHRPVHNLYFDPKYPEFCSANPLVFDQRFHVGIERARSRSAVQSHGEARELFRLAQLGGL